MAFAAAQALPYPAAGHYGGFATGTAINHVAPVPALGYAGAYGYGPYGHGAYGYGAYGHGAPLAYGHGGVLGGHYGGLLGLGHGIGIGKYWEMI